MTGNFALIGFRCLEISADSGERVFIVQVVSPAKILKLALGCKADAQLHQAPN